MTRSGASTPQAHAFIDFLGSYPGGRSSEDIARDFAFTTYVQAVTAATTTLAVVNGNVGVGTNNPSEKLQVAGNTVPAANNAHDLGTAALAWKDIHYYNLVMASDKRLKKDIQGLDHGLEAVMNMEPVSFVYKTDANGDVHLGVIAQDLEKVVPEVVHTYQEEGGIKKVNYTELIAVLVKAIQEQQAQIDAQQAELSNYKDLEDRMEVLEKVMLKHSVGK